MTVIKRENYFFVDIPEIGDTFEDCNLTRPVPARIFVGKKGLRFVRCNMTNCIPPKDSVMDHCNCAQVKFSRKVFEADGHPLADKLPKGNTADAHEVTMRGSRVQKSIAADSMLREVR